VKGRQVRLLAVTLTVSMALVLSGVALGSGEGTMGFAKNGTVRDVMAFSAADFTATGETGPEAIVLTALPHMGAGLLTLGDTDLAVGDRVPMSQVETLRFRPLSAPTVAATQFCYAPCFADGTTGEEVTVDLYLLTAENKAPVAEAVELTTYKNVARNGYLAAVDPEGDLVSFRLVDKPRRGAVTMPENGESQFTYTPYENKTGKDSFTYVAVDALGNTSQPATVSVKIEKADTKVTYADMEGNSAHAAAIKLAEEGVFVGAQVGGSYLFEPDRPVSREEFVTMALTTVGQEALAGVKSTGFADDEAIATWSKGYVSSAVKSGAVQGSVTAAGVNFQPDSAITMAEATVVLDRLLKVTDAPYQGLDEDTVSPVWAYQAAVNLESVDVLHPDEAGYLRLEDGLTRGQAAELLWGAFQVMESRETAGWFHW